MITKIRVFFFFFFSSLFKCNHFKLNYTVILYSSVYVIKVNNWVYITSLIYKSDHNKTVSYKKK